MGKNLVIVESPAKAKTIAHYLGKEYEVKSSNGHVRDLPKGNHAIDIANGFVPTYEISKAKKKLIDELNKIAIKSKMIYLASDDDREGEAISWHLLQSLKLTDKNTKRIVFNEITKNAIQNAIQNPRGIDLDLVNAQQARRILDRLVGFELSPILWKKIKGGLSAGRVQSVAVRLVVEREQEIEDFTPTSSFKITGEFILEDGKTFEAKLPKNLELEADALAFLEKCFKAKFSIKNIEKKPSKKSPAAPFTTSTLQQEASRKLGYSVTRTMVLAQKLYEAGKISYMRTDSVNLSQEAMNNAENSIIKNYGKDYAKRRTYKTKTRNAQEAHEAIRPTDFNTKIASKESSEQKLYELIRKRALASQMADAQIENTIFTIHISTSDRQLIAKGEVIRFDGFLKAYNVDTEENKNQTVLPPLSINQPLNLNTLIAKQTFLRHPPRYNEATLVKKLEELGIGRPSTYAPTINTIQKRDYVEKTSKEGEKRKVTEITLNNEKINKNIILETTGAEKNKLFPTNTARVVNSFLTKHFPDVVNYNFTAKMEAQFDDIASGKMVWSQVIDKFYSKFHPTVEKSENLEYSQVNQTREIGKDPKTNMVIYAKHGRYGAYVEMGEKSEENNPKRATLKKGQFIESITLNEALDLFKLPRDIGIFEDVVMVAAIGRFGPFIKHKDKYYSLKKEFDPLTIDQEQAIQVIVDKREYDKNKLIKSFEEDPKVQVLNGRFGPYIKFEKRNIKIPKGQEPSELTLEMCKELAEKTPVSKKRGKWKK